MFFDADQTQRALAQTEFERGLRQAQRASVLHKVLFGAALAIFWRAARKERAQWPGQ